MAVGLNADGDYMTRGSIPSGGTGTLSDGGLNNFAAMGWYYRPSSGPTYGTMADGGIFYGASAARSIKFGFNNRFDTGTATDPYLHLETDGFNDVFAAGDQPPFDEWIGWYCKDNADSLEAGWRTLNDATWTTVGRTNPYGGTQYLNTIYFGSVSTTAVAYGHYAYCRAYYGALTQSDCNTRLEDSATVSGDWGFWPLADNSDTGDDSGNSRTLTFGGTLTSETSPTLGGGATGQPMAIRSGGVPHMKAGPPRSGRTWKQRLSGIIHPDIPPLILPDYRTPRSFVSFLLPKRFA